MPPPRMKGDGRKAKNAKGTIVRLFSLLFTYYKKEIIFVGFCIVVAALVGVAPSVYIQTIASYIERGAAMVKGGMTGAEAYAALAPAIFSSLGLMLAVYAVGLIVSFLYNRLGAIITQGFLNKLRQRLFGGMQDLPISYFDTHNRGDIMSHYTNDIDTIRQLISQSIPACFPHGQE